MNDKVPAPLTFKANPNFDMGHQVTASTEFIYSKLLPYDFRWKMMPLHVLAHLNVLKLQQLPAPIFKLSPFSGTMKKCETQHIIV